MHTNQFCPPSPPIGNSFPMQEEAFSPSRSYDALATVSRTVLYYVVQ